ncbi:anion permease [Sodalis sp. RH15]|uniref:anion permease n=1 Tax=Sodalis sp. RH15 TaxID=3394330 RepID=UPI0039B5589A
MQAIIPIVGKTEKNFLGANWQRILWVVIFLAIYYSPAPEGLAPKAWQLFAIFLSTILGFIIKPYPMVVVAFTGIVMCGLTGTLKAEQALISFGDPTIWLIVTAFFISRAFSKTGLGQRIAYLFMSKVGKTTLGLAYATSLTNLVIAPVVPSNTARLGGILFPLQQSISLAYDSDPAKGTERRLGSFIMANAFQGNLVVSAMFLTAAAFNPIVANVAVNHGIHLDWGTWFMAAIVPGLVCLGVLPLVLMLVWPPEIKKSPEAVTIAKQKLAELGAVKRDEYIMLGVFIGLIFLWTLGAKLFHIDATIAAMTGLVVMLLTRVLTWGDLAAEKGAWNTLVWFSALVMMAKYLNSMGFIPWMTQHLSASLGGMGWQAAFVLVILSYMYAHYFFASSTAHTAAMVPAFLPLLLALGTPPMLAAISLGFAGNFMSGLTHYGNGSAPIFFDSGYIPLKPFWLLGLLFSVIFTGIFALVGPVWWDVIGLVQF